MRFKPHRHNAGKTVPTPIELLPRHPFAVGGSSIARNDHMAEIIGIGERFTCAVKPYSPPAETGVIRKPAMPEKTRVAPFTTMTANPHKARITQRYRYAPVRETDWVFIFLLRNYGQKRKARKQGIPPGRKSWTGGRSPQSDKAERESTTPKRLRRFRAQAPPLPTAALR